jgi:hypothetical protein
MSLSIDSSLTKEPGTYDPLHLSYGFLIRLSTLKAFATSSEQKKARFGSTSCCFCYETLGSLLC